jgi:hypothetical protein
VQQVCPGGFVLSSTDLCPILHIRQTGKSRYETPFVKLPVSASPYLVTLSTIGLPFYTTWNSVQFSYLLLPKYNINIFSSSYQELGILVPESCFTNSCTTNPVNKSLPTSLFTSERCRFQADFSPHVYMVTHLWITLIRTLVSD